MTRDQVREIVSKILDGPCPPDDVPVEFSSLHQLEFMFEIEEAIEFRHGIPEDIGWKTVNDVVNWLEKKGELQETTARA